MQVYEPEHITSYSKVSITIIKNNPITEGHFVAFISEAQKNTDRSCSWLSKKTKLCHHVYNNIRQDTCKITYRLTWITNYTYLLDCVSLARTKLVDMVQSCKVDFKLLPSLCWVVSYWIKSKVKILHYIIQVPRYNLQ